MSPTGRVLEHDAVHSTTKPNRPCAMAPWRLPPLQGAFYVLPEMKAFYGPGVEAAGYGPIADVDALCMYLIQQAHVSHGRSG